MSVKKQSFKPMKRIFSVVVVIVTVVVGLGVRMNQIHAATSPSAEAVLGPEEAVVLKKTLDVLGSVLNEIQLNLNSNGNLVLVSNDLNVVLGGIGQSLTGINSNLEKQALAFVAGQPKAKSQPLAQKSPEIQSPLAAAESKLSPTLVPLDKKETSISQSEPIIASPGETSKEVASVNAAFDPKNLLWPAVVAIVVVGTFIYFRMRGRKEVSETASVSTNGAT